MAARKVDKEYKKEVIIKAAIEVFTKSGLKNTKIIEVANKAGIGKGTVYEYFSSKEELFESSYRFMLDRIVENLRSVAKEDLEPDLKLEKMINEFSKVFFDQNNAEFIVHYWAEGVVSSNKNIYSLIVKSYSEFKKTMSLVLKEGIQKGKFKNVDTNLYSAILSSAFDGLLLQLIYSSNFSHKKLVKEMQQIFLQNLRK